MPFFNERGRALDSDTVFKKELFHGINGPAVEDNKLMFVI